MPQRAVRKCSSAVGSSTGSPTSTAIALRAPRGPGHRRLLSYATVEPSYRTDIRDHTYGMRKAHRPTATGTSRDASRDRKTTPRRPWASTEYRRTLVSGKDPR